MATITFQPKAGPDTDHGASSSGQDDSEAFFPDPVEELEDTGLPEPLVSSLIFKYLLQVGESGCRSSQHARRGFGYSLRLMAAARSTRAPRTELSISRPTPGHR